MRALSSVWQDRGARRLLTGALWLAAGLCWRRWGPGRPGGNCWKGWPPGCWNRG